MQAQDFLCDFCTRSWDGSSPMVEGHQGSLICGTCLTIAYRTLVLEPGSSELGMKCLLCLEERDQPAWRSPVNEEACACLRCVKQAAGALVKDKDAGWQKPV